MFGKLMKKKTTRNIARDVFKCKQCLMMNIHDFSAHIILVLFHQYFFIALSQPPLILTIIHSYHTTYKDKQQ